MYVKITSIEPEYSEFIVYGENIHKELDWINVYYEVEDEDNSLSGKMKIKGYEAVDMSLVEIEEYVKEKLRAMLEVE